MEVWKIYSVAVEEFNAKNYDAALKLLDEIKAVAPNYRKAYLLEAYIWRARCNFVREFDALAKVIPLFDSSEPAQKDLLSHALHLFAATSRTLSCPEESVKFSVLSASLSDNNQDACEEISNALFAACHSENFSAANFRNLYDEYKKYLTDIKPYPRRFYRHEKIRTGFLSADFKNHVMINWSRSLLTKLDKNLFTTYFYSNTKTSDNVTEILKDSADGWRDIYDLSDEAAAELIRNDEIDILFDLSGHTANNRLRVAAYRPAAVQISGIGYMNSTGLECFDYFLSDVYCAGDENFFTEKLIKLPHSHICYEPPTKLEPAEFPPCLKNNFVTFGSFNNFAKVTNSILLAWKKILDAVPDSRLILKHKIFDNVDGRNFVRNRLKNFEYNFSRVEMRGFSAKNHLDEYKDVDIALDTFPYTGGVTTCEALYMGVPVVSLYGARHGTRFGLSILKNAGLEELAVDSYDEYINRAVMLANDWELLKILRKNLRTMMQKSPLTDSDNYVREIEKAFIKILNE